MSIWIHPLAAWRPSAIRRDELRETFSNIINITKEENAQILLISGDLFDKNYVSDETIAF